MTRRRRGRVVDVGPTPWELVAPADPYQAEDPYLTTAVSAPPSSDVDAVPFGRSDMDSGWPLAAPADAAWLSRVRGFARAAVWALPAAAAAFAVASLWGMPRPGHPPSGASPGSWLVLTAVGLTLALTAAFGLVGLTAPGPGRGWALTGLACALPGTVLTATTIGVVGLARPAVDRLGDHAAAAFQADLGGGPVPRWLGVGGLLLLAAGWMLLALAVIASGLFSRTDGILLLGTVGSAVLAVRFPPMLTLASMALLAAGLGMAWSAARARAA